MAESKSREPHPIIAGFAIWWKDFERMHPNDEDALDNLVPVLREQLREFKRCHAEDSNGS